MVRVRQLGELGFVAGEKLLGRLRRRLPGGVAASLGVLLTAVGCAPATRVESFVEPVSGRAYRVVSRIERNPTRPAKVLFGLHPYATHPDVMIDAYALVRHAVEKRGLLLVIPEGRLDGDGQLHWNATQACCGVGPRHDDLGYLRSVLRDLARRTRVDPKQVFAFGVSNGAFMAQRWACAGDGELAAIVSIAGAAPGADDPPCQSAQPVSVLHVHGTEDDLILYGGKDEVGCRYPSALAGAARWAAIDGCGAASALTRRRTLFFEPLTVRTWRGPRAEVSLWTIAGGDHSLRSLRYMMPELMDFLVAR